MGAGHFLIAAGEHLAARLGDPADPSVRWQAAAQLHGVDSDPLAAELAAISVWLWAAQPGTTPADLRPRLLCADALLDDLSARLPEAFEAVVGNPPYASVFTRARADDNQRDALRARYETATGSFDLAVPFVERAVRWAAPGGAVGLVLPNKLLAADYAGALRRWLSARTTVISIADYAGAEPFAAGVYPVALVLRVAAPQPDAPLHVYRAADHRDTPVLIRHGSQSDLHAAPGDVWSGPLDPDWDALRGCFDGAVPLGDVATLAAGLTVGEAYDLRPQVFDAPPAAPLVDAAQLLTSGSIGRHRALWGHKDTTFLKRRYHRPAIMLRALPPRRRAQALSEKLIVSGLSQRPQAVHDHGLAQASVGTTIIMGSAWPLGALCALLNSGPAARLARALFGGLALSGGYLRLGKRELSLFPLPAVPPTDPRLARLAALAGQMPRADALARGDLDAQIDALVWALYGVEAV